MDWGAVIAGAMGGGAQAVGQLADDAIAKQNKMDLFAQQARFDQHKLMFAEQLRQTTLNRERSRVAGTFAAGQSGYDAANPQAPTTTPGDFARADRAGAEITPSGPAAPVNSRARDRAGVRALMESGDVDAASKYDKALDSGQKSVGYGAMLVDDEGKVIVDNSLGKQQADLMRAQAAQDRATRTGQPKALDQAQLTALEQRAASLVDNGMKGKTHPFASPMDEKDARMDVEGPRLMKTALQRAIGNAAALGKTVDPAGALHDLAPVLKQADQQTIKMANQAASQVFDKGGKPIPDVAQKLVDAGAPPAAMSDPNTFKRWFRDENLEEVFSGLVQQRRAVGKPAAAPNTKAAGAAAPATAQAAPEPVAAQPAPADEPAPPDESVVLQNMPEGRRLDEARARFQQLRARTPGLKQGRDAIDRYAKELAEAKAELEAAQRAYESLMSGANRAAFRTPGAL
jgi:hypothetical protein